MVTAYDKQLERLAFGFPVPDDQMQTARELARVPLENKAAMGSYPLTEAGARLLALRLNLFIRADHYDCFLEPLDPAE